MTVLMMVMMKALMKSRGIEVDGQEDKQEKRVVMLNMKLIKPVAWFIIQFYL